MNDHRPVNVSPANAGDSFSAHSPCSQMVAAPGLLFTSRRVWCRDHVQHTHYDPISPLSGKVVHRVFPARSLLTAGRLTRPAPPCTVIDRIEPALRSRQEDRMHFIPKPRTAPR